MPDADMDAFRAAAEVEVLTVRACRAAEDGDWDEVERCVNRRGELFDQAGEPPMSARQLVDMDLRIQALAVTAKAATAAMLEDLGRVRRNLRHLQHGHAGQEAENSRLMNLTA